jgi:hypothetical protein
VRETKTNNARLYTALIYNYFSTRSGKTHLLNLDDWTCIRKWREEGIPLEYVFNGIDRVFSMKPRDEISLKHCGNAVLQEWRYKRCS